MFSSTDQSQQTDAKSLYLKLKVKERIALREIHLRTTGRHVSMGSHSSSS